MSGPLNTEQPKTLEDAMQTMVFDFNSIDEEFSDITTFEDLVEVLKGGLLDESSDTIFALVSKKRTKEEAILAVTNLRNSAVEQMTQQFGEDIGNQFAAELSKIIGTAPWSELAETAMETSADIIKKLLKSEEKIMEGMSLKEVVERISSLAGEENDSNKLRIGTTCSKLRIVLKGKGVDGVTIDTFIQECVRQTNVVS